MKKLLFGILLILSACEHKPIHNNEWVIVTNGCGEYAIQTGYRTFENTSIDGDGNKTVTIDTSFQYVGSVSPALFITINSSSGPDTTSFSKRGSRDTLLSVPKGNEFKYHSIESVHNAFIFYKHISDERIRIEDSIKNCRAYHKLNP